MRAAKRGSNVSSVEFQPDRGGSQRWLFAGRDSWACLDASTGLVTQHGPGRLWDEVEEIHRGWDAVGKPTRDRYGLTVRADGRQWVWLDHPDQPLPQSISAAD